MDPLSVIASCIAVATIAQQTCQAFTELRTLCKEIPGRLHALNNEVADIELVLLRVAKVAENRETFQTLCEVADDADDHGDIPKLLGTAQDRLTELHKFAVDLAAACSGSTHRIAIFRAQAWKKAQTKLAILQDGVKSVKCSLNILLGASNS
jgi:enamine deaminase RidA (YjgF/YER057c/UK114 family)